MMSDLHQKKDTSERRNYTFNINLKSLKFPTDLNLRIQSAKTTGFLSKYYPLNERIWV